VNKSAWIGALVLCTLPPAAVQAGWFKDQEGEVQTVNRKLHGQLVDYTNNHGKDNRIWSRALYERRDLYVYLPPGYEPCQRYPLIMWLHGFGQDEQSFADLVAPLIDQAIDEGKLPPVIVAAPDGSLDGVPSLYNAGSFFLNTMAGDFEDFVMGDVWDFVVSHYPIRPERGAHVLAGVSMGGFSAYNLGIKHRAAFGVVVGVFPPLNLRWVSKSGRYFANFDPHDWGWRNKVDQGHEVIARFYGGLITIRLRQVIDPLFGRGPEALESVSRENPIEMVDRLGLREGQLAMYVAYGGKDEFNIDAQVESFLYLARCRGITVTVGYDPRGRHNVSTATKLFPGIVDWLGPRLAPFAPPACVTCPAGSCAAH
jgi:S-formylglutathione hydrolase FrmB